MQSPVTASAPAASHKADKEAFRRYLESTGVVDSLSRALGQLYDKHEQGRDPEDPQDIIRRVIGGDASNEISKLKEENARLTKQLETQQARIRDLELALQAAQSTAAGKEAAVAVDVPPAAEQPVPEQQQQQQPEEEEEDHAQAVEDDSTQ